MFTLTNIANVYTRKNTVTKYMEIDSRGTDHKFLEIVLICSDNPSSMQVCLSLRLDKYCGRICTVPLEFKM